MNFLPVRDKPNVIVDHSNLVVEVPNLITREKAEELKAYALDTNLSGLHRRGSKNPNCQASFYTCLIFPHNSDIYDILDPAWKYYCELKNPDVTFIEPYEIKSYVENDGFEYHHDMLGSKESNSDRKINLIVQLSDENDYEGGMLYVGAHPCSKTFGTGIFFQAQYQHQVTTITRGIRFSLIGHAWGPYTR